MKNYFDYAAKNQLRIRKLLELEGLTQFPSSYSDLLKLDNWLRKIIGVNLPLVLSDNYEHFRACLPGKRYAGQHVIVRKQIRGFTVACGFWIRHIEWLLLNRDLHA